MTFAVVAAAGALLLLAGLAYQWIGSARSGRRFPAPGVLIDIGGRRLHCHSAGAGRPAVVFEAGIAASSVSWSLVQPAIAAFTQTHSYDRAGLAWSDSAIDERCLDLFVSDLHTLLARTNVPAPYVLVAHSFGALIIRAFARLHPESIAGLVFVDPLHPEEWLRPDNEQLQRLRGGIFLSRVGELLSRVGLVRLALSLLGRGVTSGPRRMSRLFGPEAARFLQRIVGEVQKLPVEVLPAVQAHWSHPRAFRAMAEHLAALPSCSREMSAGSDALADLPVVVLSAANREPQWLAADAALARSSSTGRHVMATRGGHWLQLDEPALVLDAVRDIVIRSRTSGESSDGEARPFARGAPANADRPPQNM